MAKKTTKQTKEKSSTRVSRKKSPEDYNPVGDVDFSKPAGFEQADSGDIFNFDKIGTRLMGKFTGIETMETKKGKSHLVVVKQDNGVSTKAFMSTHLKKIFGVGKDGKQGKDTKIRVGMTVLIRLKEVRSIGSRQTYKVFDVFYK